MLLTSDPPPRRRPRGSRPAFAALACVGLLVAVAMGGIRPDVGLLGALLLGLPLLGSGGGDDEAGSPPDDPRLGRPAAPPPG